MVEFLIGAGLLVLAITVTIHIIKEIVLPALRAVAPYALMALGAFVCISIFQADAANAATISVPAGVVVGAARMALIGF